MCKQLSNATMDYYQRQPFSDAAGDSLRFLVKQLESAGKLTTADVFDLDSAIGAALAEVEAHALSVGRFTVENSSLESSTNVGRGGSARAFCGVDVGAQS